MKSFLVGLVLLGLGAAPSQASLVIFTERASWSNAASPNGSEDFNGFTIDTQFRTQSVTVNNMVISGTNGANETATNIIDVLPFSLSNTYDINSTPYLIGDLEDGQSINLQFSTPVSACGGSF